MLARIITKAIAAQFDSLRAMLSSEVERVVDKTSRATTESDMICLAKLRGTGRSESSLHLRHDRARMTSEDDVTVVLSNILEGYA